MLNPNDIAGKKFDKSMGRGYKADEVDSYLVQLSNEVGALLAEKSELEQKLIVLAEKLEEYKQDEESLRSALVGAQKLGDSVVRDAKAKASSIIDEANIKANRIVENSKQAVESQKNSFLRMQREVATFKSKLQLLYKQHLELISSIPVDENAVTAAASSAAAQKAEPEPESDYVDPADVPLPQGDDFGEEMPAMEPLEYTEDSGLSYTEEQEPEPVHSPAADPGHRESRFGPLKFGKEYDIKRDDNKRRR
ncbi:MAG: DivIVA domain-containing protein [Ruminococcaceae bacterium]|nr:DivIVA domain-containing protein [Oscillospiraceae bacterium]